MSEKPVEGEKQVYMMGNEAVAWASLCAGAKVMYGYPITPQNQIMHYWARLAPRYGRLFMQTEDEISAGFTTLGAVMGGNFAFTATSGPGHVIMQDAFSMAEMMRLPIVAILVQRGGPSTATVIYSQQEVYLAVHGGNGEGLRIVYSTSGHQDLFDYTVKAYNTAWKYRFPTFVLSDGYQGQMRESLTIYDPEYRGIKMVEPEPYVGRPGSFKEGRVAKHWRNTFSIEEELEAALNEIISAYESVRDEIVEWESFDTEDAELVVVAHGIVARGCREAVRVLRDRGFKVGFFRPITLAPFPEKQIRKAVQNAEKLIVVESAQGQLRDLVKLNLFGECKDIYTLFRPGVGITPNRVVREVEKILS